MTLESLRRRRFSVGGSEVPEDAVDLHGAKTFGGWVSGTVPTKCSKKVTKSLEIKGSKKGTNTFQLKDVTYEIRYCESSKMKGLMYD